jgi:diguanylate cyclase (GGDEF)-like protein
MTADGLPTVLIVDDERVNRTVLAELLRAECRLVLAKDGPSALRRIAEEAEISLILLDVTMPGMDGYEVLRRLQADARTADIGVIFVTSQTDEEDEERGLLLGAADYVSKPIRPAIVLARVRNQLKLAIQRRQLERLSQQDGLTGIANRRRFDEAFDRACRRTVRKGEPLCLAMIDVDHFKQYNDHYGHGAGDEALRKIARVLVETARRPYDLAARYGGEEFVLLMPGDTEFDRILEQLRLAVAALAIDHAMSNTADVLTISCGAIIADAPQAKNPQMLLQQADLMLYQAKRAGRNRVLVERVGPDSK